MGCSVVFVEEIASWKDKTCKIIKLAYPLFSLIFIWILHSITINVIDIHLIRYPIGNQELPYFVKWCQETLGVEWETRNVPQDMPTILPEPIFSAEVLKAIRELKIDYSIDSTDRLIRAHGHTLREIYLLKQGFFERIPDVVLWPSKLILCVHILYSFNS